MGEEPRIGDHRWWISDLAPFQADYPDCELRYGIEEILQEMYEQNVERWTAARGMKLSVVIPAQNEEGSVGATVEGRRRRRSSARGSTTRCSSSTTTAKTRPTRSSPRSASATRASACHRSHYERGFGMAIRAGLDVFEGDAVAIVMADASDDPEDLVRYHRLLEEGWDCAFGSRFVPGAQVHDYPRLKYVDQPPRQPVHPRPLPPPLQRHHQRLQGLPARGDRDDPAAALQALQPHRRDAAEGDRPRPQLRT